MNSDKLYSANLSGGVYRWKERSLSKTLRTKDREDELVKLKEAIVSYIATSMERADFDISDLIVGATNCCSRFPRRHLRFNTCREEDIEMVIKEVVADMNVNSKAKIGYTRFRARCDYFWYHVGFSFYFM